PPSRSSHSSPRRCAVEIRQCPVCRHISLCASSQTIVRDMKDNPPCFFTRGRVFMKGSLCCVAVLSFLSLLFGEDVPIRSKGLPLEKPRCRISRRSFIIVLIIAEAGAI